jgi:hypothetical protein
MSAGGARALDQRLNCLRLIAGRLKWAYELKGHAKT